MAEGVEGPEQGRSADPAPALDVAVGSSPGPAGPNGAPPTDGGPETGDATVVAAAEEAWGADGAPRPADAPATLRSRISSAADLRQVPLATILATVGVVVATGLTLVLLWVLRIEVLYIVVACFVAVLLTPPVKVLERRGVTHGLAVTIVFLLGVLFFSGVVFLFGSPLVSAITHFSKEVPTLVRQAEHGKGQIGQLIRRFHLQHWIQKNLPKLSTEATKLSGPALNVGEAAFSTLLALGTMAVLSFFILLEGESVGRGILGIFPPHRAQRFRRVAGEVQRSVSGYMLGDIATSVIAGIVVGITLAILGVPFAFLLGLWVGLVDLLPLVGGLLAAIPVAIVALLHSFPAFIVIVIVGLTYQQIENHILNPVIMSKTVRLNPLWVLLAVLVGAKLGGTVGGALGAFVGALIGIPAGGAVQVIVREIRRPPEPEDPAPAPQDLTRPEVPTPT